MYDLEKPSNDYPLDIMIGVLPALTYYFSYSISIVDIPNNS